ncbi:MAG: FlgD immunoglobulin-like domain containing protein, partial [Candidatus Eiseniibacteriota bacterium]
PVQPDDDASPGTGFCFVTGNGAKDGAPASSDIDGGKTTLTSPPINISGMTDPMIGFQRWYYMNTPGEPDSFLVDVSSDGVSWIRARTIRESHAEWHPEVIRVRSYLVPGATVRVRFTAQDEGVGSVVEAAVDDIEVHDASLLPTPIVGEPEAAPVAVVSAPWPNPTSGLASISLQLRDAAHARVAIYDVSGRLVAKLYDGVSPAGKLTVRWNGKNGRGLEAASGVYWIHAQAAETMAARRLVLAR